MCTWTGSCLSFGLVLCTSLLGFGSPMAAQRVVSTRDGINDTRSTIDALLAHRVTIALDDVSRDRAIDAVARNAKIVIQYRGQLLRTYSDPVTIRVVDAPLGVVLERILSGTPLRVSSDGVGHLTIVDSETALGTDSVTARGVVAGRVVDSATGRGLSGATIKVVGTKLSAVTSDSGGFTLKAVPLGERVLAVRLFGYKMAERAITLADTGRVTVRIRLASVSTVLSGVVTTATGTQRRLEVGNDIAVLNVDSIRQVAPITTVTDILESRVPGLTVVHSSGAPGDPARIRLRGTSSITGNNDPIIIVDGIRVYSAQSDPRTANTAGSGVTAKGANGVILQVPNNYAAPSPLDQIDPNSIETIEVLKGPSASSLYGSDAANGVIVITTKKGRSGPTHWTTMLDQGLSLYPGSFPEQTLRWGHNNHDGGFIIAQGTIPSPLCDITGNAGNASTSASCNTVDSITHLQVLNYPRWSPVGHGSNTDASVSVSGGVSALTYALTGSGGTTQGYLKLPDALADAFRQVHGYDAPGWAKRPNQFTTWGGSGQLSAQLASNATVTLQSNILHGFQSHTSLEKMIPTFQTAIDTSCALGSCGGYSDLRTINAYERATDEQLTFTNALNSSWSPMPWLPITATAGISVNTGHDVSVLPRDIVLARGITLANGQSDTLGRYGVSQKSSLAKTLNVSTTIPGWRGRLRTAFGVNVYALNTSDLSSARDTLAIGVTDPGTLATSSQSALQSATYGWFFEPRVTLSQRFYLTPGFRLDGGNANGGNASASGLPKSLSFAALFPKVNFSWIALDRQDANAAPFLGVLTLLRPRLALGSAGVQPTPGERLRLVGAYRPFSNNTDTLGLQTLGNTQLRPERSVEIEGGFDAEAWHNRANLTMTFSRKVQHDAILPIQLAPSVYGEGVEFNVNIGEVQNTGAELTASVTPIVGAMVNWTVSGNFSYNNNKIVRLDPQSTPLLNGGGGVGISGAGEVAGVEVPWVVVGYPINGRWDRPVLGYADANGDGIIQESEIRLGDTAVYLGRPDPAVTASVSTDVTLFRGRLGVHASFAHQGNFSQLNTASSSFSVANDSTATTGQQACYVASLTGLTAACLAQTVSYWEFQSVSVGYNVPRRIAAYFHAPWMRVALQGSNLALWSNYRGKDPNVNAFPNSNGLADAGQQARPRTWSLQVTLGN